MLKISLLRGEYGEFLVSLTIGDLQSLTLKMGITVLVFVEWKDTF